MKSTILVPALIVALSALAGCATPTDPRADPRDSKVPAALEEAVDAREAELSKPK
jgi:hypothetical protein